MNYFECLRAKEIDFNQKQEMLSEYTYSIFEKEVIDRIPEMIETMLENFSLIEIPICSIILEFKEFDFANDKDLQVVIGTVKVNGNVYPLVDIYELNEYLEQFASFANLDSKDCFLNQDDCVTIRVQLIPLINYYYEELQREEYNKGIGRK